MPRSLSTVSIGFLLVLFVAGRVPAQTYNDAYTIRTQVSGGGSALLVSMDGVETLTLPAASVRGTVLFGDRVGLEGEYHQGLAKTEVMAGAATAEVDLNYAWGLYGRGDLPLNDGVLLFGRVGMSGGDAETELLDIEYYQNETGFSYGAGFQAKLFESEYYSWGVRADWTHTDFAAVSTETLGLSLMAEF